jgi:paraquat-inducible protein B
LVALGLRAQLQTASLITGQLVVAFDFFPDAPPAQIVMTETYPIFPTVPTDMAGITRSLSQALDKVAALPIEDVVQDVRATLGAAQQVMRDADARIGPLITSLRQTSDGANTMMKSMDSGYGRDSQVRGDVATLLKQLQETARSTRQLTDYLERHPDSVIRGRATSR